MLCIWGIPYAKVEMCSFEEAIEGCLVNSSNLMEMEQRASIREVLYCSA